jgi:hypothetical protein
MKHLCLAIAAVSFALTTNAQNGVKWAAKGNSVAPGEFLGSTNNQPLVVKTNNTTRFTINANGDVQFNHLAGAGNQVLSVDNTGKLIATPTSNSGQWQRTGNDYFIATGNVGIGIAPSPGFKLDVIGDMRVSNNLLVGGGIIITNQVQAATQIKSWDVKVDNNISIDGSSLFKGATTFNASPLLKQGVNFDAAKGIGYTAPVNANDPAVISFGNRAGITMPMPSCYNPNNAGSTTVGGVIMDIDGYVNIHNSTNTNQLVMGFDGANNIIESGFSSAANPNSGGLLINYYCGKNTAINTGVNGGRIDLGKQVHAAQSLKIGYDGTTTNVIDPNVPLAVYYNGTGGDMFSLTNASTNKINFKVKSDGVVYSRELNVQLTAFPDYVFKKDYQLMSLENLARYIADNKHLPNVPSAATVEKDGANLGELSKIQLEKIEELTLYILELKKELDEVKKKVNGK